jgi:hypothetical protein
MKPSSGTVIVRLSGGLGNQMFQYAQGRAISYRNQSDLALDISYIRENPERFYLLHHFNITARTAAPEEIQRITNPYSSRMTRIGWELHQKMTPYYRRQVVRENNLRYDPRIRKISGPVYLQGYWQSEKYFVDIKHLLVDEFTLVQLPDAQNQAMLERIDSGNSISLHIRRGDYIDNPIVNKRHGTCTLDYYAAAVDYLYKCVNEPRIFVFSDDIIWVQEHFRLDFPLTYVDHNGVNKCYEDFRLMTHCNHHIVANSSFSWWGAWLCNRPGKIVIAPAKWFNIQALDDMDLVPVDWIRL